MFARLSLAQLSTLADLFGNFSAGFFGLVFIEPFGQTDFLIVGKNILLGIIFYYLAFKLKEGTL